MKDGIACSLFRPSALAQESESLVTTSERDQLDLRTYLESCSLIALHTSA